MQAINTAGAREKYSSALIALHWLTLLLIIATYACIELREFYPRGSDLRRALKAWHFMMGLSVFVVVWVRLAVRLMGRIPPITPPPPKWQMTAAHLSEFTIYVFMIAMPILGWFAASADNATVSFFGLKLPSLIAPNKPLTEQLEEIHGTIGDVGYFLIGLHAAAALFHHFIKRDDTLRRMLPGR